MAVARSTATRCCASLQEALDPELFQALADPTRLTLVCRLVAAGQPLQVSELSQCCGVHLSGVSRHLAQLRRAGVLRAERRGRTVFYELQGAALAATLRTIAAALDPAPPSEPASCSTSHPREA